MFVSLATDDGESSDGALTGSSTHLRARSRPARTTPARQRVGRGEGHGQRWCVDGAEDWRRG
eukprot:7736435-Lingulodinium_polyedra.AAC.1